jgi:predicted nucleotidyltransferase
MRETIRWTVKVSKETDISLRTHLAQKGTKKGDLSKFIEDAVRWRVLQQTVTDTKARNRSVPPEETEEAIDEALQSVRAERLASSESSPSGSNASEEGRRTQATSASEPAWPTIESPKRVIPTLITAHDREISTLCRRYAVRELALFGSILRSDFDAAKSGVDVAVDFGPPPDGSSAGQYFEFKHELESLLEHPVDLVELGAMENTRLKRIIETTKVPIYAAPR